MSPGIIFSLGLLILGLFGWYFMEQDPFRKKVTASVLTLLLVGLCIASFWPPFDGRDAARQHPARRQGQRGPARQDPARS